MRKIEWMHSESLNEKYCKITRYGVPDIYYCPKDMTNTCAMVVVKYGSADMLQTEPAGIAHFLEHKMFTCEDGGDAFDLFADLGADANAYTSFDRTVYFFNCTQNFSDAFSELLKMINSPYFTDETVKKEQGIIAQEIGMYDDEPDYYCWQNLISSLYLNHPVKHNICGTVDSIKKISPDLLYTSYEKYYNPSNFAIVICGNIDIDEVCDAVEKNISHNETNNILFETVNEPLNPPRDHIVAYRNVSMPIFNIGYKDRVPSVNSIDRIKRHLALSVLMRMLFSTSGALYNELYDMQLITSSISYNHDFGKDYSFVTIGGMSKDPDTVCSRIDDCLDNAKKYGLNKDDFERSRRVLIADFISRFDSTEDIANAIAVNVIDEVGLFEEFDLISKLDIKDVELVLNEVFDSKYKSVSLVLPIDNQKKGAK